ncbi:hypothetical protein E2562_035104 [Oryza meyeriana var. granulata]|uniref:DNA-directed RNA polymerase subunit n=1 Tax=Oryza meyeriana var. granulata TaxID=110450 RepID=A0A6G1FFQ6_9ORYZ|nr:hypothetical protein E2562_035104 [Oryza meyeriana var. granulata]
MEEDQPAIPVAEGTIKSIKLSLSTEDEIRTYSINDCPVTHPSQLGNPFLGLPLETGKCESCGASENGKCEGHFGYIELPVPIYHPCHVTELRQILNLICLKCLRIKKGKVKQTEGKDNISASSCYYCRDLPASSLKEIKTADGAFRLELKAPPRKFMTEGSWNFLDKYGFHHGGTSHFRTLLPEEALNILKKIPDETKRKLAARGYIAQSGYVMKYLPVPPNCLYIPEFTDGQSIMSYDISISLLKKVLQKIEQIKKSRAGTPNFESHEVESSDLQLSIAQYIHLRGTTRGPQDNTKRFSISTDSSALSTKQWLEKMRTLFISKGSGFSSRSVLTGDPYIGVDVVGLPSEVAKRITFEEQVTDMNINRLQEIVDKGLCLTYRDGQATYAITVGSKGHTTLKVGQTISRRIVDGDIVFLNRPPSTHKHSLQAFRVYVHEDHTVKINPLICSPFAADFDGDCVHIYYPQSLAAKAEALELFSVEKQLTSSHSGKVNLQLASDSLLALKHMSSRTILSKEAANQLAMLVTCSLPDPAVIKSKPYWTIAQIVQGALPKDLTSQGDKHLVRDSTIIKLDLDKESVQTSFSDLLYSTFSVKGPGEALQFLNVLQPLLMELILLDGFSVSLQDFNVPKVLLEEAQKNIEKQSLILEQSRCAENQFVEMRVDNNLKDIKQQISDFVVKRSHLGHLIDPKSDPSVSKVVQQLGFVGLQLYREGKFYSRRLVEDCFSNFVNKHPAVREEHSPEAYGLVRSSYFHGLNPYEELVHAISTREAIVRSSRGLTEPGTLFKNLMAQLRDVVICYDGTVRNVCSKTIIQLNYKDDDALDFPSAIAPGEPVGVLAATAISNPAYKAVLDASQSNNTSWEQMKKSIGDPRIQEAKIVWVGSDAASWVKNTQKASKGEPAVEIIVEEEEALHSGDAWRTTMDACIPVLNLIDTQRSIPYGIQQVRELLGISCAFDQVVQRLSTTVRMVAKDVLKDHLVLVANSMTFTGSLNGFNNAGYKATFRSLKVQVPFTESTLITPMKCFEKAAEKCHSDSLGCVVSSCSWGKHAASGTGSSFQILWNESQLKSNKEYGDGLYDYLALVRTDEEKARYTFFDDVDYLAEENEADMCLSPELDGTIGQPTLDDNLEEQDIQKNSSWENDTTMNVSWEQNGSAGNDSDKWGGWNDAAAGADMGVTKPADQGNSCWDVPATVEKSSSDWGGWGTDKTKKKENMSKEPAEHDAGVTKSADQGNSCWDVPAAVEKSSSDWGGWGTEKKKKKENISEEPADAGVTKPADLGNSCWHVPATVEKSSSDWGIWGTEKTKKENISEETAEHDAWSDQGNRAWGKRKLQEQEMNVDQDSWGNMPTSQSVNNTWDKKNPDGGDAGNVAAHNNDDAQNKSWESVSVADNAHPSTQKSWGNVAASPSDNTWNAGNDSSDAKQSGSWDGWNSARADDSSNKEKEPWGNVAASPSDDAWNSAPVSQGNNNSDTKQSGSWDGWNSAQADESSNKDWKADGWGARGGNWRGQRNNPGRPPRRPDGRGLPRRPDERGPPRRYFDLTAEEEKILGEIEPIVLSIRKIFRESIDGIRLSLEDEKFIKENVLEHHPEKQSKVSGEIDHIMVDKHQIYQDSRCLFVMSSDGTRSDFSYLKCMENYVRKTYTEHGDSFCKKYFKRRRDQAPAADGGTAPGTPAEATQSTAAETQQGTPQQTQPEIATPPAATPQETPVPPSAPLQETSASPAEARLLGKGPSPSLGFPADAGLLGKGPSPSD